MSADWLGARLHCSAWSVLGVFPGRMDQRAAAAYFHRHYRRDDPWAYGGPAEQRRLAMVEESLPPVPSMTVPLRITVVPVAFSMTPPPHS